MPQLFADAWNRLAPILEQAIPGASQSTANQYASFIRAMDAASSFSGIGQRLGIFRITPDALRSAAGLIGAGGGDPLAYTAEIDAGLRALLGFTGTLPDAHPSPLLEQGRLERVRQSIGGLAPAFGPLCARGRCRLRPIESMGISLATPFQKKKINSRVAIWRWRRIQPTTPVPAGLRAIAACVKRRYGKKSTMRSGPSSRRSAPAKSLT